jgi:hypothetical protein
MFEPRPSEQYGQCSYDIFPAYFGGSNNEKVNCMVYDEQNELIIVGGRTNSDDFAPAANDHGFLVAVDLDGHWIWGNFFYNVSYAVSDITGCKLSSNGTSVVVSAKADSKPVVMNVGVDDGSIKRFTTIEDAYAK